MIIPRAEWGANPKSLPVGAMRLPATEVFIHHSVTGVSNNPGADMRDIEAVGLTRFGVFSYSYVVHPRAGEVLEGCGLMRGAHTAGRNSTAFGICWVGNYDQRAPRVQQLDATRRLIAQLTAAGLLVPGALIRPHRDVFSTACPGSKLYVMLDVLRTPWEATVPDDPNLPNIRGPVEFHPVIDQNGICQGYYIVSLSTGEIHGHGPGARYHGRSEVIP